MKEEIVILTAMPISLASHAAETYRHCVLMPPGTRRFSQSRSVFSGWNEVSFWVPPAPATQRCNARWAHRPAWRPMVFASGGSPHAPPICGTRESWGEQGVGVGLFLQVDPFPTPPFGGIAIQRAHPMATHGSSSPHPKGIEPQWPHDTFFLQGVAKGKCCVTS